MKKLISIIFGFVLLLCVAVPVSAASEVDTTEFPYYVTLSPYKGGASDGRVTTLYFKSIPYLYQNSTGTGIRTNGEPVWCYVKAGDGSVIMDNKFSEPSYLHKPTNNFCGYIIQKPFEQTGLASYNRSGYESSLISKMNFTPYARPNDPLSRLPSDVYARLFELQGGYGPTPDIGDFTYNSDYDDFSTFPNKPEMPDFSSVRDFESLGYPDIKIISNVDLKIRDGKVEDWRDLVETNNGESGTIIFLDELQNWFASNESKDFPPEMLEIITQQRKDRKMIICTTQVFTRLAKPLREQASLVYLPFTIAGCLTFVRVCKPVINQDGVCTKMKFRKLYFFVQTDELRNCFNTYEKVKRLVKKGFQSRSNQITDGTTIFAVPPTSRLGEK